MPRGVLLCEIKEELSVKVIEEACRYDGAYAAQADNYRAGIIVKMICYAADHLSELKVATEVVEIVWLIINNIQDMSAVDKLTFADFKTKDLID